MWNDMWNMWNDMWAWGNMICEMMICESEELSHLWSGYH